MYSKWKLRYLIRYRYLYVIAEVKEGTGEFLSSDGQVTTGSYRNPLTS
jgi:hypothetical protein